MELEPLKPMSTQSYQFNNLYVMCSLNERAIYMKIMDKSKSSLQPLCDAKGVKLNYI